MVFRFLILICFGLLSAGCNAQVVPPQPANSAAARPITVLAAASTTEAMEALAKRFQQTTGVEVRLSTGPSNGLAQQILSGAPADIFISANTKWPEVLAEAGASAEIRPLLTNELVLIVPPGNPAGIEDVADLLSDKVQHLALAGVDVPAGMYADQALKHLGLFEQLQPSIVRGQSVRVALSYVERGEAEAGIVYATDARLSSQVQTVLSFASETHDAVEYPAVLLKQAEANPHAQAFYRMLFEQEAAETFRRFGFAPAIQPPAASE